MRWGSVMTVFYFNLKLLLCYTVIRNTHVRAKVINRMRTSIIITDGVSDITSDKCVLKRIFSCLYLSQRSKCNKILRYLHGHCERRNQFWSEKVTYGFQRNLTEKLWNFVFSTVPVDCIAMWSARTSVDTAMTTLARKMFWIISYNWL